jgi:hypothetical protein
MPLNLEERNPPCFLDFRHIEARSRRAQRAMSSGKLRCLPDGGATAGSDFRLLAQFPVGTDSGVHPSENPTLGLIKLAPSGSSTCVGEFGSHSLGTHLSTGNTPWRNLPTSPNPRASPRGNAHLKRPHTTLLKPPPQRPQRAPPKPLPRHLQKARVKTLLNRLQKAIPNPLHAD